jgi:hypothetical protein
MKKSGKENTEIFQKGACETLRIARLLKADMAILSRTAPHADLPIYDGTFSGKKDPRLRHNRIFADPKRDQGDQRGRYRRTERIV